ncbi:MAG: metal-sensitive transcriptional regulator [Fimbriimonadaceae bacterium]|nr:MAG: metal-sensitive transcriptional regulator [Fimbriimonadaceae bacterium]
MQTCNRQSVDRRLARIEGQVRGLRRMVTGGDYCCDVLVQMAAVRSALDQAAVEIAANHVETCIIGHEKGNGHVQALEMSKDDLIDELRTTLKRLVR